MNQINVFLTERSIDGTSAILSTLGKFLQDLNEKNIVVVPDKLSLITEQNIFKYAKCDVYLNCEVMGINSLAQKIIGDAGLENISYTKEQCLFLTRRAIQKCKNEFLCFNKNVTLGLCEEIYNTISQLKTSNISPAEFVLSKEDNLGNIYKYHDIKIVYEEYNKLLDGKLDASEVLNLFNSVAQKSNLLKNTRIFFVGFDTLTIQGYEMLTTISKFAKDFYISIPFSIRQNKHIYSGELLNAINKICSENKINKKVTICDTKFNSSTNMVQAEKKSLLENVYSYKISPEIESNSYTKIFACPNVQEEINFTAKTINYYVKNNAFNYGDFAIVCPSDYFGEIKNIFNSFNINYYLDEDIPLSNLDVCKFLISLLEYLNFSSEENLSSLLYYDYLNLDENLKYILLTDLYSYDIFSEKYYNLLSENINESSLNNYLKFKENIIYLKEKCKKITKNADFCDFLSEILLIFDIETNINDKILECKNLNLLHLEKVFIQVFEKIKNAIENVKTFLFDEEINLSEFIEIIESAFASRKVKSVPISLNSCLVISPESFVPEIKNLFILGANEGTLPIIQNDSGLLSDKEIENERFNKPISPTIKNINKQNKFKLFEFLTLATNNLFITYHLTNAGSKNCLPANFVLDINKLYKNKILYSTTNFDVDNFGNNNCDKNLEKLKFNLANKTVASTYYGELDDEQKALVKKCLNNLTFTQYELENLDARKLFLDSNKTKVSQLEKYFACPKAHFFAYGLKLKKNKDGKIEATDYGTLLHKVVEIFVSQNKKELGTMTESVVCEKVKKIIAQLKTEKDFEYLNKQSNMAIKKLITSECERVCLNIENEQKVSAFKPVYTEYKFGYSQDDLKLNVNGQPISLVGVIDRVDLFDNNFRIIDYKTGSSNVNYSLKDIFTGEKIQAFLYLKALTNRLKKDCFGAFYYPIKYAYQKQNETSLKMRGYFSDDARLILHADKTLGQEQKMSSDYFNVTLSKSSFDKEGCLNKDYSKVTFNKRSSGTMPKDSLYNICDYTKSVSEQALQEILDGNISASPIKDNCKYCEFRDICFDRFQVGIERKFDFDVKEDDFALNSQNEDNNQS